MSTSDTKVPLTLEQVRITAAFLQTSLSANETSWRRKMNRDGDGEATA